MKIAVVINTSWNIFNFRMGLVKALQKEGAKVYAIAPFDSFSQALIEEGCYYIPLKMDSRGANPLKDLALTLELYQIYRKIKPDVILHYTIKPNIYGTLAASLLNVPMINNVSGLGTVFLNRSFVSRVALMLYRQLFRYPRKVFFQNSEDLKLFVSRQLVRPEISQVIPGSGVPLEHFICSPFQANEEFTFLVISRLIKDKGIQEYIEAIKILKKHGVKARFQLLGAKDPEHKRGFSLAVIQQWQDEQLVEYLGTCKDVRPVINQADCIVLPSYREGTPRTLLEAAALSKPIVTTDVPGCNNAVEDGFNGFLCRVRDAQDLADKMMRMLCLSEQERERMGLNGRLKVEAEFDERIVVQHYLKAVDQIVNKKGKMLENKL
jgi:glycosyltransferase involved in cell wall biosynthesis